MSVRPRGRQQGIALVLYTVGLLGVVAMSGFALDLGRAYLAKARLQNALDAAALDAAHVLFNGGSTAQATAAALANYGENMDAGTPAVSYSSSWPFGAEGADPKYVKVSVASLPLAAMLSATFLGSSTFAVAGTAIAGPQPLGGTVCGVPLAVCGTSTSADHDCSDGDGCWGLAAGELTLKDDALGPGNFGLMDMGSGANAVADAFAGKTEFCAAPGETHATQPGKASITTFGGLNSRFGAGAGPYTGIGDLVTTSPQTYAGYKAALGSGNYTNPLGVARRRTVLVSIVDCSAVKGKSDAKVLDTACVFLTRQVPAVGALLGTVYAEMIDDPCPSSSGTPGTDPASAAARIVLYQSGTQS